MESRILEITLQYAKDLNKVNLFTKTEAYTIVSLSGNNNWNQKTKTPTDHNGDSNPVWNFPMKFTLDEAAMHHNLLTLDFQIICQRMLGDKDIGEVHVSVKELFDSWVNICGKSYISYQVTKPSGKSKGQLSFSYQFGEKVVPIGHSLEYQSYPVVGYYPPTTGYHPYGHSYSMTPFHSAYGYGHDCATATPSHEGYGYPPAAM